MTMGRTRGGVAGQLPRDFFGRAAAMTGSGDLAWTIAARARSLQGADWVPHWALEAVQSEAAAEAEAAQGRVDLQISALRRASACYMLGAYPAVDGEHRAWAYRHGRRTHGAACRLEQAPVEVVQASFAGQSFPVHLRRGAFVDPALPPIVFFRGLDSTKEVTYWDERAILRRGFVIGSVDLPGMGENPCPMMPDSEMLFAAALDAMAPRLRTAGGPAGLRVVVWGLGFGGYWAYKLAAVDPRVCAAISIGGPVHFSFAIDPCRFARHWREVLFLQRLIRKSLGTGYGGSVASFVKRLSLVHNGALARTLKPLVYVNGDSDLAVSPREPEVVQSCLPPGPAPEREVKIFRGAGHLAIEILDSEVLPWCLDWIERRFRETAPAASLTAAHRAP